MMTMLDVSCVKFIDELSSKARGPRRWRRSGIGRCGWHGAFQYGRKPHCGEKRSMLMWKRR